MVTTRSSRGGASSSETGAPAWSQARRRSAQREAIAAAPTSRGTRRRANSPPPAATPKTRQTKAKAKVEPARRKRPAPPSLSASTEADDDGDCTTPAPVPGLQSAGGSLLSALFAMSVVIVAAVVACHLPAMVVLTKTIWSVGAPAPRPFPASPGACVAALWDAMASPPPHLHLAGLSELGAELGHLARSPRLPSDPPKALAGLIATSDPNARASSEHLARRALSAARADGCPSECVVVLDGAADFHRDSRFAGGVPGDGPGLADAAQLLVVAALERCDSHVGVAVLALRVDAVHRDVILGPLHTASNGPPGTRAVAPSLAGPARPPTFSTILQLVSESGSFLDARGMPVYADHATLLLTADVPRVAGVVDERTARTWLADALVAAGAGEGKDRAFTRRIDGAVVLLADVESNFDSSGESGERPVTGDGQRRARNERGRHPATPPAPTNCREPPPPTFRSAADSPELAN